MDAGDDPVGDISRAAASGIAGRRLGRYELIARLGAGGMGVVYQARDLERSATVALKTLHRLEPEALLRLKNEFRFVANVTHPNLVALYELCSEDDQWFFTMEYVPGQSLAQWLRPLGTVPSHASTLPVTQAALVTPGGPGAVPAAGTGRRADEMPTAELAASPTGGFPDGSQPIRQPMPLADLQRIFRALADGVSALHAAGKLHCDIKPGNVMLSDDGRVVLLDFGLVSDRAERASGGHGALMIAGTPEYMAPEQMRGKPATEASDWYAFGTMLYEALTGRLPFRGEGIGLLYDKLNTAAAPLPEPLAAPPELARLAMALLERDPALRPTGAEVHACLGGAPAIRLPRGDAPIVGRDDHLAALTRALDTVKAGRTVTVHVHGGSGMGKTALVQRFLAAQRDAGAVVLTGRCYERESVPYKAFDSLIDSLTRHLQALPEDAIRARLPEHAAELARVFPVLREIAALSPAPAGDRDDPRGEQRDQQEVRRRAFRALKDLLARIAEHAPLVLHIDDLQWGDADSFALLDDLPAPPGAPRLLLVCSFRSEDGRAPELLAEHRRMQAMIGEQVDVRELVVGRLDEPQSIAVAAALLGTGPGDARAREIAQEADGTPLFIEELVNHALSDAAGLPDGERLTLDRVVLARVAQLPAEHRRLLGVVAVAGRPLAQGVAARAADLAGDVRAIWTQLRAAHLVRTQGPRKADQVESFHDRIRESVTASLAADALADHHRRLATAYEAEGGADPEVLSQHWLGGGVRDAAGRYAALAADRAAGALAFARAAELYRRAAECLPGDRGLRIQWADALVNAGKCAEAAPLYLEAARDAATAADASELRRRAAEQLLVSGRIEEGVAVLRPLLAEAGLPWPATPRRALIGLIGRMIQLDLRGIRFDDRAEPAIPRAELRSIDTAWTAGKGLGSVDIMRGAYFIVRSTHRALAAGDARRVSRGLAHVGLLMIARGIPREIDKGRRLIAEAERIARAVGDPHLIGFAQINAGTASMTLCELEAAAHALDDGVRLLEQQCTGVAWECSFAHAVRVNVLRLMGEFGELAVRGSAWLRTSDGNGDRYGAVWIRIHTSSVLLAADDPGAAEAQLTETANGWSAGVFTPQHMSATQLACECDLYRGEPVAALRRLERVWKIADAAYATGWQITRVLNRLARASAALACGAATPAEQRWLIPLAGHDARQLEREGRPYARAAAALIRAAIAHQRGEPERALAELDVAVLGFDAARMKLYAACARRRRGELLGGDAGRDEIARADAVLRAEGIRDVRRWTAVYAAGFEAP
ncbi:MAG TPA: protein kinase [Kofleriaceae bacterium]|nr:protein kinase [Kofleriaceae bacterium]